MAALSDLDEMLRILSAERGLAAFSASSLPRESQVINWINDGIVDLARRLCPRRLRSGEWAGGRLDKLLPLLETYDVNIGLDPNNPLALPSVSICFYAGIKYGPVGSQARATEATLMEIFERGGGGSPWTITSAGPVYTFADGGLWIEPLSPSRVVTYYYLTMPGVMSQGGTEDFPLGKDMIPLVLEYVMGHIWAQSARNVSLSGWHLSEYLKRVQDLIGDADQRLISHIV